MNKRIVKPQRSIKWLYFFAVAAVLCLTLITLGVYSYRKYEMGAGLELSGTTINVRRGGNFQSALDRARPGDTIMLEAGATFRGNFVLPNKEGSEFITIRSSASDSELPPPGTRIDPKRYAAFLPKISTNSSEPAISTAKGAHHYRFVGVEITPDTDKYVYNLVMLGVEDQKINEVPHHIEFDRCYLHPDPKGKTRRGIALNNSETIIMNSHLSGFAYREEETQAICGWFGPGPFKILNNYLEAGAENVMFGGAHPGIKGLVPSDIEIRGNYMSKPLEWRDTVGTKCVFELKNARRVVVSGNIMENSFHENAVRLTVRGEESTAPWATIEDVVIESNIIRNSGGGFGILGVDDSGRSETMKRVKIVNNLFLDIDSAKWGGDGRFITITDGEDITVANNTVFHSGNIIMAYGNPSKRFIFRDNIISHNDYGFFGDGIGVGKLAIAKHFPDGIFAGNVIINGKNVQREYMYVPPQNYFAPNFRSVGFADLQNHDFRLAPKSAYKRKGSNGQDPGVDFELFEKSIGKNTY